MNKPVIVIGAGGHAKVVIDTLKRCGVEILGVVDANPARHGGTVLGVPVLGSDDEITMRDPQSVYLVNGIGSTSDTTRRREIFERFKEKSYTFLAIIHPAAVLGEDVEVGEGSQIMAGTIIQPGTRIGANCIVNTRAAVDHDCTIGDHVHIAPGAVLSGGVVVESGAHVGTGASVIHEMKIGRQAVIGAGAAVVRPIGAGKTVTGVPGKVV